MENTVSEIFAIIFTEDIDHVIISRQKFQNGDVQGPLSAANQFLSLFNGKTTCFCREDENTTRKH
jgi:hypothetical protein